MLRSTLRSARSRLVVLALVGLGFVFASSACGEETSPSEEFNTSAAR